MGPAISTPRKRPRQKRSQQTYDAILDAAAHVFEDLGYTGATTNKIAERAGVSIGSLYQYFPDKDALLYALGERHMHGLAAELASVMAGLRASAPPADRTVRTLYETVAALHSTDPRLHRLLYDQAPRPAAASARLRAFQSAMAAEVEYHLRRLDLGAPDPVLTAVLLVQAAEAQIHGAILDPPPGRTTADCLETAIALCLAALGVRPPN
ncbi:TetR/AcrR family transcriptional regulator [Streptomyces sp. ME19-01-6]|uniref:TetR/AcrR family transcriptional regulator n=1 Tax=Streptomyces sp. ME19-01-6 TaxID=3028686 RepID=UPI0029B6CAEC|nr:TetR/AcrR family transcriptional regulator [Streptomyces sp. ME19-01-6]MDX3226772.1 TetR/AcrR family transcriptional regulator [Streptomyces sp. ME19-01-6]